jgi:hypothetical protein
LPGLSSVHGARPCRLLPSRVGAGCPFDGRFFTCVKTTGIYCRPICPARPPKIENCRFVPTAAAAQQAGFQAVPALPAGELAGPGRVARGRRRRCRGH